MTVLSNGMAGEEKTRIRELQWMLEHLEKSPSEEVCLDILKITSEHYMWPLISSLKHKAESLGYKKAVKKADRYLAMSDMNIDDRISACIIGKNRAEGLERCLLSIKDKVDEIVYIDTGSDDNSVEVAKRHGAVVDYFEWRDDFSAARNVSIAKAKMPWILIIDTDEELKAGDLKKAIRTAVKTGFDSITFKLVDIRGGKPQGELATGVRIMRREYAHYVLPVHNQIINWAQRQHFPEIELYHYGYDMTGEERKKRNAQTQKIALEYIKENDSAFMMYNLAVSYLMEKNFGYAIDWFEEVLKRKEQMSRDLIAQTYSYLVKIYSTVGDTPNMIRYAQDLERIWQTIELYFDLGMYFYRNHVYDEALKYFEIYLKLFDNEKPGEFYVTAKNKKEAVQRVIPHIKRTLEWEERKGKREEKKSTPAEVVR